MKLDPNTLRDLAAIRRTLAAVAQDIEAERPGIPERRTAGAALDALVNASYHAFAAKPDCGTCHGYGTIEFPVNAGPEDYDTEERTCPTCRPWPQGFPGLARRKIRLDDGSNRIEWAIAPYGPGENARTRRAPGLPDAEQAV